MTLPQVCRKFPQRERVHNWRTSSLVGFYIMTLSACYSGYTCTGHWQENVRPVYGIDCITYTCTSTSTRQMDGGTPVTHAIYTPHCYWDLPCPRILWFLIVSGDIWKLAGMKGLAEAAPFWLEKSTAGSLRIGYIIRYYVWLVDEIKPIDSILTPATIWVWVVSCAARVPLFSFNLWQNKFKLSNGYRKHREKILSSNL